MKTIHIHMRVENIPENIEFYNTMLNSSPTKTRKDYAQWKLDDPKINFSLSAGNDRVGIEHLGIQVENTQELQAMYQQIEATKNNLRDEEKTVCCYAKSEKSWVRDPQGIEWEVFHTFGESETYSGTEKSATDSTNKACCGGEAPTESTHQTCC